jgi:LysM repeat protein
VPGDELPEIGRCFGTTVAAIQQENNLTSTTIIARQTLLIPDAG